MRRVAALPIILVCLACSEPPQKEIDRAQGALEAARAAGAEQYARESFTAATEAMQETHEAVQQRDYRLALSRAIDANERALEAATEAANGKARARAEAEAAIARVDTSIQQLDERLEVAVASRLTAAELDPVRRVRTDADRALQEARARAADGDYPPVTAALHDLPERITDAIRALNEAIDTREGRGVRRRR
jgi:chromosome segregation ATPase